MLTNITINPDTNTVEVKNPEALVAEAEARTQKPGPKTYVERFLNGKTRLRRKTGWYPEEKKIEVAALFASGVTKSSELERLTGIKAATIRDWRTSDWWVEMLEKVHAAHDTETVSKLTKIVDTSLELIQDRLLNGDYVCNPKTGEIYRKPASLRDVTVSGAIVIDKRQLLRGKAPTKATEGTQDAVLKKLADEFKAFVKAKDITPESSVTKIEVVPTT